MMMRWLFLILLCLMPQVTFAEDDYEPPPMFGNPSPAVKSGQITKPILNEREDTKKDAVVNFVFIPAQVSESKPPISPPAPQHKPVKLVDVPNLNKNIKKTLEPIDLIEKNNSKKLTSSVVKGPKVMPSVPKEAVQAEVIFAPDVQSFDDESLIDRIKKQKAQLLRQDKQVKTSKSNIESLKDNLERSGGLTASHVTLFYGSNGNDDSYNIGPIVKGVVDYLKQSPDQFVYIESYATAGYQRSLKRALTIRSKLIELGVPPFQLYLMAYGNELPVLSPDSVDIKVR